MSRCYGNSTFMIAISTVPWISNQWRNVYILSSAALIFVDNAKSSAKKIKALFYLQVLQCLKIAKTFITNPKFWQKKTTKILIVCRSFRNTLHNMVYMNKSIIEFCQYIFADFRDFVQKLMLISGCLVGYQNKAGNP